MAAMSEQEENVGGFFDRFLDLDGLDGDFYADGDELFLVESAEIVKEDEKIVPQSRLKVDLSIENRCGRNVKLREFVLAVSFRGGDLVKDDDDEEEILMRRRRSSLSLLRPTSNVFTKGKKKLKKS